MPPPTRKYFPDAASQKEYNASKRVESDSRIDAIRISTGLAVELAIPRQDVLLKFLIEEGILTEKQVLDFETVWQDYVSEQLTPLEQTVETVIETNDEVTKAELRGQDKRTELLRPEGPTFTPKKGPPA